MQFKVIVVLCCTIHIEVIMFSQVRIMYVLYFVRIPKKLKFMLRVSSTLVYLFLFFTI